MPGAFDPQEPAQRADSVGDSQETVAVRVGAADAILADFKREDAVVDRGPDCRPRRMSVLDGVRERLGHDEIRARLDVRGQPLDADEGAPTPAPTPGSRSCATLTTVPPGSKRPKCVASTP